MFSFDELLFWVCLISLDFGCFCCDVDCALCYSVLVVWLWSTSDYRLLGSVGALFDS